VDDEEEDTEAAAAAAAAGVLPLHDAARRNPRVNIVDNDNTMNNTRVAAYRRHIGPPNSTVFGGEKNGG